MKKKKVILNSSYFMNKPTMFQYKMMFEQLGYYVIIL